MHWEKYLSEIEVRLRDLRLSGCPDPFFRGHSQTTWKLEPSLARGGKSPNFDTASEGRAFWDFRMLGSHLLPARATSWTVLYYMQHHGLPTRLLDWTADFATALYFALKGPDPRPAIWILDPYDLNKASTGQQNVTSVNVESSREYEDLISETKWPYPIIATTGDASIERMRSQAGAFTLHGDLEHPLETLYPDCVSKHVLPRESIPAARQFLWLAGKHEFNVFPDLDGLARYICEKEF